MRQRRRERAGDLQQPPPAGARPPPDDRGDPDLLLRHQGVDGLPLPPLRVHRRHPDHGAGDRRGPRGRPARQEHPRLGLRPGDLRPPRRRGLHLRRGDRPDREPRRQARLAPDQAAVPGRRGGLPQADGRQQRRDALLRPAHRRARGRLVQVDRHAQELRAEALLDLRPREQAGLRRAAAGRHHPRADRGPRRRRLEGPQGQGGRPRRDQHGPAVGRRAGRAARLRGDPQDRLPRPGDRRGDGHRRPDADHGRPLQHLPLLRPRELRPVHPLPRGDDLVLQDPEADQGRRRPARRPRRHGPAGQEHGHHPRHHHLRPGRRRRLADQERDGQVPARAGRVHPDAPAAPPRSRRRCRRPSSAASPPRAGIPPCPSRPCPCRGRPPPATTPA